MTLQIRDIIFQVFEFLWGARLDLARMIAAPVFALTILHLALTMLVPLRTPEEAQSIAGWQTLALLLGGLLSVVFYTMFAVAWHRRCLRPEEQTTIVTALKWDGRKTRFLLRFFLISIIAIAGALPVAIIGNIVGFTASAGLAAAGGTNISFAALLLILVVVLVMVLIQTRLSLILPATALDQKLTLMEAWVLGRGNTWRLFAILLLSVAPAMVLVSLVRSGVVGIAYMSGLGDTLTFRFVAQLAINFASYIAVATSISALSMSYKALRRPPSSGMPYHM